MMKLSSSLGWRTVPVKIDESNVSRPKRRSSRFSRSGRLAWNAADMT
jgi:hypothetical protein